MSRRIERSRQDIIRTSHSIAGDGGDVPDGAILGRLWPDRRILWQVRESG
ncbi:hypothetical protein JET14_17235 [Martelella lutilitoris]|uniref:Uncharacterized protein n=1 Tax=Martelella lutilitoris TaxID=2583532 RepID=A0A7T7HIZ8_9HYPH|nr:hypothetical protein [Martelella lutilitoris]QQM30012.1 hypothetical protein JET14_17235 [Martelella lutilitoris]